MTWPWKIICSIYLLLPALSHADEVVSDRVLQAILYGIEHQADPEFKKSGYDFEALILALGSMSERSASNSLVKLSTIDLGEATGEALNSAISMRKDRRQLLFKFSSKQPFKCLREEELFRDISLRCLTESEWRASTTRFIDILKRGKVVPYVW